MRAAQSAEKLRIQANQEMSCFRVAHAHLSRRHMPTSAPMLVVHGNVGANRRPTFNKRSLGPQAMPPVPTLKSVHLQRDD